MSDVVQWMRFREEIEKLIEKNAQRGGAATIHRREVEGIGASLNMTHDEACREFLGLYGNLWALRTGRMSAGMIRSHEDPKDPPRSWSMFNDVVLLF